MSDALWTRERLATLFAHEIPIAEQLLPDDGDENLRFHSFHLPLAAIRIVAAALRGGSDEDDEGMCSHEQSDMTKLDWAAARLANAVGAFLEYRDPSSLSGLKQVFSEYRLAERGAA